LNMARVRSLFMPRISLILMSIGLLVVSACNDGDNVENGVTDEDPTATAEIAIDEPPPPTPAPTPETDPTVTPMPEEATDADQDDIVPSDDGEHSEIDDSSGSEDPRTSDEPFGAVPDIYYLDFHDEELSEILLHPDQMPEGWSLMVEGSLPEDAEATHGLGDMMSGPCGNELLTPEAMGHPSHVGRHFIGQGLGPFFGHDLFEFDNEENAEQAMELARAQLHCDDWIQQEPDTGSEFQYTVENMEFPDLGDDRSAVSLSIRPLTETQSIDQPVHVAAQFDGPVGTLQAESVIVRQGSVLSIFTFLDWLGDGDLPLEDVVTAAVEQIEAVR
jgi:hypothetical protein